MTSLGHGLLRAAAAYAPHGILVSRGPSGRRRVALTFDDGPDASTAAYLELLDRLAVRATFFLVGDACRARGSDVLAIARRGHEIGNHSYHHRRFTELSRTAIAEELRATEALLPAAPRRRPMVRPPQGATSLRSVAACALAGYRTVLWSLDSDDCRTRDPHVVAKKVAPGEVRDGEIVLLHEGQSWTLAALPTIVRGLRDAGFELTTVGDLLGEPQ